MKLGLVQCTNDEYHAGPGESKSGLDDAAKSLAHYWDKRENPLRQRKPPTPALVLGSAVHAAILEPNEFLAFYIGAPEVDRRTKAGKEEYALFSELHADKTVLTRDQWDTALAMRDSVYKNPRVVEMLSRGRAEQSYYGIDPETGALIKCRTDWIDPEGDLILDVKTTMDASPEGFIRSVLKYRYHVQVPWYRDVIEAALDAPPPTRWVFLAVEKTPPYACALYTIPGELVRAGRELARRDLHRIVQARQSNEWPAYGNEVMELVAPPWAAQIASSPEDDFEEFQ